MAILLIQIPVYVTLTTASGSCGAKYLVVEWAVNNNAIAIHSDLLS